MQNGPSPFALAHRFSVLLGLITQAAWVWLRLSLARRRIWRANGAERVELQRRFAARFAAVAVRFRGGLIKIGQVASLRVDVFPEEVSDELAKLQDRVDPHAFAEIEAQLERELGGPIAAHFARFERVPLAAASLGQVHAAWIASGEKLAVKVLYPGVEQSVAVDLAALRIGLALFNLLSVSDLRPVYREIRGTLYGEMDYVQEGRAAERVASNLAADPEVARHVRIPRIHWPLTRRRVLCMEFIEGGKINDREALAARGLDVRELVGWATRAFLHMIFRDGFFHCDPHPGNLLVDETGRVGIVDFGMHKRLASEVMAMVRENLLASVSRDAPRYARSFLLADVIDPRDLGVVEEIARISFDPAYFNLTPKELSEIDVPAFVKRMRTQMSQVRSFRLPDGLVMWSRALGLLFGLSAELAPGLRPLDIIGPYVLRFLTEGAPALASERPS